MRVANVWLGRRGVALAGAIACLAMAGGALTGCTPPHTPDSVVGNQGTQDPGETGAVKDSNGRVVSNPSTGAGDRADIDRKLGKK